MAKTTSLQDYKDLKKSEVIVQELEDIHKILKASLKALKDFDYYTPVKDVLPNLKDAKTLIEVHLNHHKNLIKNGAGNG